MGKIITMELLFSGGWIGREGLWEAKIKNAHEFHDLEELEGFRGFVVISYDLTEALLPVSLKSSPYPPIIALELGDIEPFTSEPGHVELRFVGSSLSEEGFLSAVAEVKRRIERGEVYQVNLTNRFIFKLRGDPRDLFLRFYQRQPVPFAFFLKAEGFYVISGSMELFLRKEGNRLWSKPIKGTGSSPGEVLQSEKERAENLMITDMVRNDLGRVARVGSVKVRELFGIEVYRTLCQMYSTVEAETDEDAVRILRETFPPASVTGAPKISAVRLIDALEPHPRGYYCGTAGFLKEKGDFVLSVLIRTAYGGGEDISYFAGCGIVWDSVPAKELEELYLKVRAFYRKFAG